MELPIKMNVYVDVKVIVKSIQKENVKKIVLIVREKLNKFVHNKVSLLIIYAIYNVLNNNLLIKEHVDLKLKLYLKYKMMIGRKIFLKKQILNNSLSIIITVELFMIKAEVKKIKVQDRLILIRFLPNNTNNYTTNLKDLIPE